MKKYFILLILLVITSTSVLAQSKTEWVNQQYNSMTLEEKIGQLFMVAAYSNKNESHVRDLEKLVEQHKIGGVIFFQGGPHRQAVITNRLQAKSKTPLFVGIDAEWGLSMRLDSTHAYPFNMTLGAIQDRELIRKVGEQLGEQANRMHINFIFGPVVDINTNPKNPIIGVRSYGEDKMVVAQHAIAFKNGLEQKGVLATAKHFPGHGDTSADSHHILPYLNFSRERLNEIELYPYQKLIQSGLSSVMVAHLEVKSLEPKKGLPTSLSYKTITELLRNEMKFDGLIFTDALNMKGVTQYKSPGDIDLEAFKAGNDILLFSENVPLAAQKIKKAIESGEISAQRLEQSIKRILGYKYPLSHRNDSKIVLKSLNKDLNKQAYKNLNKQLFQAAMTWGKKPNSYLNSTEKIAYIKLGDDVNTDFVNELEQRANVTSFYLSNIQNPQQLKQYDRVILGFHKADNAWRNHDFTANELKFIQQIAKAKPTTLVAFTKPYALLSINNFADLDGVLLAYQNNRYAHQAAVEALFGEIEANGKIPVSIPKLEAFANNKTTIKKKTEETPYIADLHDLSPKKLQNLAYSTPKNEGLNANKLKEIDQIAQRAVDFGYTPGCQVLVARNGKIVYQKAFGKLTDDYPSIEVTNETIYDLASLTKILATLPMVMKMHNDGVLKFDQTLGQWLPEFKNTDKANITIKEMLMHESGLAAWIPFYRQTLIDGFPDNDLYQTQYSPEFPVQVSEHLYLKKDYRQEMMQQIVSSTLGEKKYRYSDLNFILLKEIVEKHYRLPFEQLVEQYLYHNVGTRLMFNPLRNVDVHYIAPSEKDNYFRHDLIRGYVHDMGAAMMGGVAGHAGLFGNAEDVFKMMQFYLDKGKANGKQIFSAKTLQDFNQCYSCQKGSRRGAGFDKPQLPGDKGPTCGCASPKSFGHTGFTGTIAWADPDYDLVYVFLSNRTYPHADENKLSRAGTREDIQQVIYDAIIR